MRWSSLPPWECKQSLTTSACTSVMQNKARRTPSALRERMARDKGHLTRTRISRAARWRHGPIAEPPGSGGLGSSSQGALHSNRETNVRHGSD